MRPINHGTALSPSAMNNCATNKAANSHFACRAKCHRKAIRPDGGSGFSGGVVGDRKRSKNANICGWLQAPRTWRQCCRRSSRGTALPEQGSFADLLATAAACHRRRRGMPKGNAMRRFVGALVALVASAAIALADSYPSHPITMLVAFPPGAPTDTLARILADAMAGPLGQSVVVETVSGASGTIATGRLVHPPRDGYTIGIGNGRSHVGSPALYKLDYDIIKDLQPVSLLAASPLWIVGKNGLPPKTATALIA